LTGLDRDLEHVLAHTAGVWEEFRGASLFITGGTGFFGHWLLSSFVAANQRFGLSARALVLTRDAAGFKKRAPDLVRNPAISLQSGDVRTFDFPSSRFSHIIHAATPASAALNSEHPLEMQDIIIEGTRRVLDLARQSHGAKLLLCSSGLRQPGS
jgi:dTDP-glucose 4,6-dehydratase